MLAFCGRLHSFRYDGSIFVFVLGNMVVVAMILSKQEAEMRRIVKRFLAPILACNFFKTKLPAAVNAV